MLPARHRLREQTDFRAVVRGRSSRRAGGRLIVVHANRTDARAGLPPRVGFVVSKAVGTAVVRNHTKRRLRAIVAAELGGIGPGWDVVIRANPAAADASFADLADAVHSALQRVCAVAASGSA